MVPPCAMSVRKKRATKASAYSLAKPIPAGTLLTCINKQKWIIRGPIAQGGFGCIYSVRKDGELADKYVAKIEPQENGPLFTEIHFYIRVCTKDSISTWMSQHRLTFLGVPRFITRGFYAPINGAQCRFLIMDRFSGDFESVLEDHLVGAHNVVTVAIHVLNALEYLHSKDYVHADIKASNLLYMDTFEQVTLVDFGLAYRFRVDGKHQPPKVDPKYRHNGTIEFCSRDSHAALPPSRRGDLEILMFNLIHWLSRCRPGSIQSCTTGLPWGHLVSDPKLRKNVPERVKLQVAEAKEAAMRNFDLLLGETGVVPNSDLTHLVQSVADLGYEETPNYTRLRHLLESLRGNLKTAVPKKAGRSSSRISTTKNVRKVSHAESPKEQTEPIKRPRGRPLGSTSRVRKQTPVASAVDDAPVANLKALNNGRSKNADKMLHSPDRYSVRKNKILTNSPLITTPTRSSPRLRANPINSLRLRYIFDSDDNSDDGLRSDLVEDGKTNRLTEPTGCKVLTPLNPHDHSQSTSRTKVPLATGRRSGFCQTSPELLLVAKAEALGRRAAKDANRRRCEKF